MTIRKTDKSNRGIRGLFDRWVLHPAFDGPNVSAVMGERKLPPMPGTIPDPGRREMPTIPGTIPDVKPPQKGEKLSDLKPGQSGTVKGLRGNAQGRLRLMEMGITPGAQVQVVHAAAFGGPLQINIRGYQLSLRREEASAVILG